VIAGFVRDDEPIIKLRTVGSSGGTRQFEAVVDTGFSSALSLPHPVIAALELTWHSSDKAVLGDGTECFFDIYEADLEWDGKSRRVLVHEADTDPLVGMSLLRGYELRIQVRRRGKVTITRLSK
jgi:clan AA aspartic protease